MSDKFTHINASGNAHMVDVTEKNSTERIAIAQAYIEMSAQTLAMIVEGKHHKGDVFATARIAGIMAAKKTSDLIPLCHPLMLTKVDVDIAAQPDKNRVQVTAMCKLSGKTGVEMEALTAASTAALTIYDMCKAVQKDMVITNIHLCEKQGGKSGPYSHGSVIK